MKYLVIGIDASVSDGIELADDYEPIRIPLSPLDVPLAEALVQRIDQVDSAPGDGEAAVSREIRMSMRLLFLRMKTHADLKLYMRIE
jgi:hypothetical protein